MLLEKQYIPGRAGLAKRDTWLQTLRVSPSLSSPTASSFATAPTVVLESPAATVLALVEALGDDSSQALYPFLNALWRHAGKIEVHGIRACLKSLRELCNMGV